MLDINVYTYFSILHHVIIVFNIIHSLPDLLNNKIASVSKLLLRTNMLYPYNNKTNDLQILSTIFYS